MAIQRRTTPAPTPSAQTAATQATPVTPAAGAATTTTPTGAGGTTPSPSGAGQVINAIPVTVNGLQGATANATAGTANRFGRQAVFDNYTAVEGQPVSRGFIRTSATPIAGGARIHVESFHAAQNDTMTMHLQAEVIDTKTNQMRAITLAVLTDKANLNGNSFRGNSYFDIKYDDVNKYLQQFNPNLKLTPGTTTLAVAAVWGTGHQAGGFARGGAFRLPASAGVNNAVNVRAAAASGASQNPDLPLDMQVNYPAALVQQVPQLKPDGSIQSRLESELKVTSNEKDMKGAITSLYGLVEKALAGDKKSVESVLGKDWTIESVNRYWAKDDGSPATADSAPGAGLFKGFRVDGDGLPIQDPMHDVYMDDSNLRMTRHQGAIRLRTNSAATVINVKPGSGRRDDKTSIVQRVEVGLELKPGTSAQQAAAALQTLGQNATYSGSIFNHAQRQVQTLDPNLVLQNALVPAFDVRQDRHKFTVKNEKTGVEVELSLDKVNVKSLRAQHNNANGTPRESEFWILEAELDHLQLASTNQSTYTTATTSGAFTNDQQQTQWLSALSTDVTMDVDPRLHELSDLQNDAFRRTSDYKAFEGVIGRVLPKLFPNGTKPAVQKAAQAAEAMGLVFFDDKKLMAAAKSSIEDAGFKWSPTVKDGFEAAFKDPAKRINLEVQFSTGGNKNIPTFVQQAGVALTALEYEPKALKARISGTLEGLGLKATPEILKMFDAADVQKLPPANLDRFVASMTNLQDAQVMQQFAQALGVTPVPAPTSDIEKLFGPGADAGTALRTGLETAKANGGQASEIEDFFRAAAKNGATSFAIRQAMRTIASNPQAILNNIGQQHSVSPVPQLQGSAKAFIPVVEARLKQTFQTVSPELVAFFEASTKSRTLAESTQFFNTFARGVPDQIIAAEATRLGVPAPKMAYDWGLIETNLQARFDSVSVVFDAPMKKYVRELVEAGVPVSTVNSAMAQLQNNANVTDALKRSNIFVVGLTPPPVKYDAAKLSTTITSSYQGYGSMISLKEVNAFAKTLLDQGLTPTAANQYAVQLLSQPKANALQNTPSLNPKNAPSLPIDEAGVYAQMLPRLGTVSPEQEKYIKAAIHEAADKDALILSQLVNRNLAQILAVLPTQSGMPRPAGV